MAVSAARAAEVLAFCARHCCICRRFRPLHLQVHHIIEQNEGGTDDLDNLIPACVSCHCDVHTETLLTRRFTEKELKLHRDNVYQLVAEGKLRDAEESEDRLAALSGSIVHTLLTALGQTPAAPVARPQLPAEAVEILLAAVEGNSGINVVKAGGAIVLAGGKQFGDMFDFRIGAKYKNAINLLFQNGLIDGHSEYFEVMHAGYLLADDILAAGGQKPKSG